MQAKNIIVNMIETPDGTILTSKYTHDYISYKDNNGEIYMVDGGHKYLRRNVNEKYPYIERTLYEDSDFTEIRKYMLWGTYGKNGDQPLSHLKLKDIETEHIEAIIKTQKQLEDTSYLKLFKKELEYRNENKNS